MMETTELVARVKRRTIFQTENGREIQDRALAEYDNLLQKGIEKDDAVREASVILMRHFKKGEYQALARMKDLLAEKAMQTGQVVGL